jgi:K+-sensing histidine kinase KdpD
MERRRFERWLLLVAVAGPLLVAAALIPWRDDVAGTNVALVLVVVVVAVAASGVRWAGIVAALSAAAAFNLFHTVPYYSLRISSPDDLETTVLLLAVGLAVGEIAVRARRARAAVVRGQQDLASLRGLSQLVAQGEDADYVLLAAESELTHLLGLTACQFEMDRVDERVLPVIARDGSVRWGPNEWDTVRWGLPSDGATIPVWSRGARLGRFVLTSPVAVPYTEAQLAQAVALVDQAGAALAQRPAGT